MAECEQCGAPITLSRDHAVTCRFCEHEMAPIPERVEVPVPVQVVHNVVNVVGDRSGAPAEHRCPHCRRRLVAVVVKGVTLEGCGSCGGIWVANESAVRVLKAPEAIFGEMARRAGNNAKNRKVRSSAPACPVCTAVLLPTKSHGIELDTCSEHGTWFDAYELARLVGVLTGTESSTVPLDEVGGRRILCADCSRPLPADRANIGPNGLVCESCWRSTQAEQIAAAEASDDANAAIAVGGVLLGIAGIMLGAASSDA